MSESLGKFEDDAPLDVPTMMKLLMTIYNTMRDDEVMDEVSEVVGDAICMLGDMRSVAQQVLLEDTTASPELSAEFIKAFDAADPRNVC